MRYNVTVHFTKDGKLETIQKTVEAATAPEAVLMVDPKFNSRPGPHVVARAMSVGQIETIWPKP